MLSRNQAFLDKMRSAKRQYAAYDELSYAKKEAVETLKDAVFQYVFSRLGGRYVYALENPFEFMFVGFSALAVLVNPNSTPAEKADARTKAIALLQALGWLRKVYRRYMVALSNIDLSTTKEEVLEIVTRFEDLDATKPNLSLDDVLEN